MERRIETSQRGWVEIQAIGITWKIVDKTTAFRIDLVGRDLVGVGQIWIENPTFGRDFAHRVAAAADHLPEAVKISATGEYATDANNGDRVFHRLALSLIALLNRSRYTGRFRLC